MCSEHFAEQLRTRFEEHHAHPALSLGGRQFSYGELLAAAKAQAEVFASELPPGPVGILAVRSWEAYTGILAAVLSGRAYVPLQPKYPLSRLVSMTSVAGCAGIVCDENSVQVFQQLQAELGPDWQTVETASAPNCLLRHRPESDVEHRSRGSANACFVYLLFTSGSTGKPKGIGITPANLLAYLSHATSAFGVRPGDRASQMFELTFDLSVHDLFVTWLGGGLLCVPDSGAAIAPARFIIDQGITHWFSVPSTAVMLSKLRLLREGAFPSLKQSLFCGEALPVSLAEQWLKAAPHSNLWNLYGPTETTIAITAHEWSAGSAVYPWTDTVPIGCPFPGQRVRVIADGVEVRSGELGELCLAGAQVSPGYLSNPAKTAECFVQLAESAETWYRTGDLVRQDESGILHYLGRLDSQIQLRGHRVELGEVEGAIRSVSRGKRCAAMAWPSRATTVESIVAFIESTDAEDVAVLRQSCAELLPDYMVPTRFIVVPDMPLNSNGKIDREALSLLLS
jgi:amino acid adenylation domain-containing protein